MPYPVTAPSRPHRLASAIFSLLLLVSVSLGATPPAGSITLEQRAVTTPDGQTIDYELGTLFVPENRADPQSRIIGVGFARFRALQPTGAPPTFHLPGGPGGSYVRGLNLTKPDPAQRVLNERQTHDLALYRAAGDVVYVDQRGASDLGDRLAFRYEVPAAPLDQPGSMARETADFVAAAKAAVADARSRGIDLAGYTVKECADDVNDLRVALGYDRVTLIGQSYGSQWSFATMRRHPSIVARAVLSGVEPIDCGYDMPSHIYAAMLRSWWAAEKTPELQPYLPPGGIAGAVRAIFQRLEQAPLRVPLKDAKTGAESVVVLGRDDFRPGDPRSILAIYHGHYEGWAQNVARQRRARTATIELIGPVIDSGLAVTPLRRHLLRNDAAIAVLGEWNFDEYMATEEIWPSPDVGDDFRTERLCDIPVVFVHGDWDTSTPVENLLHVLPFFTRSRTVLVHQGLHSAYAQVRASLPDATAAIMDFVRSGDTINLPAQVTVPARGPAIPEFSLPSSTR